MKNNQSQFSVKLVFKNSIFGFIGEVFTRGSKIIQIIVMTRLLSINDMGLYNYASSYASIFSVIFDFGIGTILTKKLSNGYDINILLSYTQAKFLCLFAGFFAVSIFVLISGLDRREIYIIFGMGIYLAINDLGFLVISVYRSQQMFSKEVMLRGFSAILQLGACFMLFLVNARVDVLVFFSIIFAMPVMIPILQEWRKYGSILFKRYQKIEIIDALVECLPIFSSAVVTTIYMNFDVIQLGHSAPYEEVALYSIAYKTLWGLPIMPVTYFLSASFPAFTRDLYTLSPDDFLINWIKIFRVVLVVGGGVCILIAVNANFLLSMLFGSQYVSASNVLLVMTLSIYFFHIYTPLSQFFLLLGKQNLSFYSHLLAMVINLIFVIILIPLLGLWGAVLAYTITHITVLLSHLIFFFYLEDPRIRTDCIFQLLRVILGFLFVYCVVGTNIINIQFAGVFNFILYICFCVPEIMLFLELKKNKKI